jgi:AcrR family transcriptional regulator
MARPPLSDRRRAVTRRETAEAAARLFLEHGFEGVGVDRIASAAGLSLRTFYRYFPSKEDVLAPLFDDGQQEFVEAFAARPAGEDPFRAAIAAYREATAEGDDFGPVLVQMMTDVPALRARWLEGLRRSEELLVPLVRERVDPEMGDLDVQAIAALVVLALRLPLEHEAAGTLEGTMGDAQERILQRARRGVFRKA